MKHNCVFRRHVGTKEKNIKTSLLEDIVETLENMEAVTLELLLEIVTDFTQVSVHLTDIKIPVPCILRFSSSFTLEMIVWQHQISSHTVSVTQRNLKMYFKMKDKQFFLAEEVKTYFSNRWCCQDVQEVR